jgi:hypothetical protein
LRPTISPAAYPKRRAAAGLTESISPVASMVRIASTAVSTIDR